MSVPQELFAETLWMEWQYGRVSVDAIHKLLQKYNLKPQKDITDNDLYLVIGRALKGACTHDSRVQINKIAEEVARICVIARWNLVVSKYKDSPTDEYEIDY